MTTIKLLDSMMKASIDWIMVIRGKRRIIIRRPLSIRRSFDAWTFGIIFEN